MALEASGFLERKLTESREGLTVSVAVPSRDETTAVFGTSLYAASVQPVWVEVSNDTDTAFLLLRVGMDVDFYSAREAAYARRTASTDMNEAMASHLEQLSIGGSILPGTTASGFVYTTMDEGHKSVYVDLVGDQVLRSFSFVVPVPGLVTDVQRVDFESIYADILDCDSEDELRDALRALPGRTTNKGAKREGDPLNIVLIGSMNDIFAALIRRGWHQTEVTYAGSAWKTFKSFLFGSQYLYSPISRLYAFGRPQDIGLQKARGSVHARNHMRLWRAPIDFRGQPVFLGQISRDIGVRFTTKSSTLTTHAIDPDVDDTRDGLVGDLAYSQGMPRLGFVEGVPVSTREAPLVNLTGDPFFTNGMRAVMFFAERPTSLEEIDILDWDMPPAMDTLRSP